MPEILNSALAFLAAIALLVAIHEYGHYIVARAFGIKVLRFSIGFGRPIWIRRAGPDRTEYCVSAIPLGGYVKLLDERDCAVSFAERGRAFNRQPIPARIAVLAAGPAFNLVFAVVAYWFMFMSGVPGLKPVIGTVTPESPAAVAGLRDGDQVVAVGGRQVATWEGATLAMLDEMLAEGAIPLTVADADGGRREVVLPTAGRESQLTEPGRLYTGLGFAPWAPRLEAVLGELTPGGPAERAEFRPGDRILGVEGEEIADWEAWVKWVRAHPGSTARVDFLRDGTRMRLSIDIEEARDGEGAVIGRIGAAVRYPAEAVEAMRAEERYGPVESLVQAARRTGEMSLLTLRMIWRMIVGDVSVKNISGPINIAQYAGVSASIGLAAFLSFLAVVSISLGVLNLLPVPLLDGGQILYSLVEAAKGSPLSERAQIVGQQVGILLLLVLMSFAFYNDLSRLFG
jgi:regulator of sigma E protease